MTSLFDLDRPALAALLGDEPSYRTQQVWEGLYRQFKTPEQLSNVPMAVRSHLTSTAPAALEPITVSHGDRGATTKWLFELADGSRIETVLMAYEQRCTVCVSTQAGCAMACSFCATGQGGFARDLTTGEIVEQLIVAARAAAPARVSNVVFMGMGEPLANYEATWSAVERLHAEVGISARNLTISTVGVVPGIRRMAAEALPVGLAVSLHAATDALRDELVPINRRYGLAALLDACADYHATTRRRISFEWALIDGRNDTVEQAGHLAEHCRRLRAHVNLIPLNPTPGHPARGSPPAKADEFARALRELGVNATIRDNRGRDIHAACGQLLARRASTGSPNEHRPATSGANGAVETLIAPNHRTGPHD